MQTTKVREMEVDINLRLKGKKGPPARGAAPKGLGGVEPEKQPLRFADANHLPFQGRQSILNANWYDFKLCLRIIYLIPYLICAMEALRASEPREAFLSTMNTFQPWGYPLEKDSNPRFATTRSRIKPVVAQVNPTLTLHPSCTLENAKTLAPNVKTFPVDLGKVRNFASTVSLERGGVPKGKRVVYTLQQPPPLLSCGVLSF